MWLTGIPDERVTRTAPVELARTGGDEGTLWSRGELAVWLWRLGLDATVAAASPSRTG